MTFIPFQIIAVFTNNEISFNGNPAACVFLDSPLDKTKMQPIAKELNLPATSFIWKEEGEEAFKIRWFAPDEEIGLCGHGSAAAAVFLGTRFDTHQPIRLRYNSGEIIVIWKEDETFSIKLDPIPLGKEIEVPEAILKGLGIPIIAMYETDNKHLILTDRESSVRKMQPDFERLRESEIFGYTVTAQGDKVDFVSRTLVPHVLQLEDHATGSSHAILVPFWAKRFDKDNMQSLQFSPRGGAFVCGMKDGKVILSGEYEILNQGNVSV
ncbi:MAG: PhzF family phenazine biosynthesis protein [Anditalea sp.]